MDTQPTISSNWGNQAVVQQFRSAALSQGLGLQTVDSYIKQMQDAYQQQNQNTVTSKLGQNQGDTITPDQLKSNVQGGLNFLSGGGKLLNTGPDAQAKIISDAGKSFEKTKNKDGFVNPQAYNTQKAQYLQAGGNSKAFDDHFADNYVNPNNAFYDTPEAKAMRSTLPMIKQAFNSYQKLGMTGAQVGQLERIPIIGDYLKQGLLHSQNVHDSFILGEAGNIRGLAGAGPQQGFRFNMTELNNIANLMPLSGDSKATARDKAQKMDTFLQNKFGTNFDTVMGVPQKGGK